MPANSKPAKSSGRKLRSTKPSTNANTAPMPPNGAVTLDATATKRPASPSMRDTRSFAAVVNGTPPSSPAIPLAVHGLPAMSGAEEHSGRDNVIHKEIGADDIAPTTESTLTQDIANEGEEAGGPGDAAQEDTMTMDAATEEPQDSEIKNKNTNVNTTTNELGPENEPVLEALHQSVRRRRTSTKGKGREVDEGTPKDASNGDAEIAPLNDDELRASDAARKRRRLSTTPTPSDGPSNLAGSNVELRVQHAPQAPLNDGDGDIAMGETEREKDKRGVDQVVIPSPSAASSDFLWGSLGEIDPEVLALLNVSDGAALGVFQGDVTAPSTYDPQRQGVDEAPGPSKANRSEGHSPPRWMAEASAEGAAQKPAQPREEDDIFRPEPITYEEPDLFTRITSNMCRAAPPAPARIQYIRRNLPQPDVEYGTRPGTQLAAAGPPRSDTPRPLQPKPVLPVAAPKLPSFRRYPANIDQGQPSSSSGQRREAEVMPPSRVVPAELDDMSDPLLHLDDLIEDFDPSPAPVENAYEVTLPADARRRVQNTNPYWKVKDMGDEQKRLWSQNRGPAILIHFPGCGTSDPSIGEKINLTRLDLAERFGVDGNTLRLLIAHAKNPHNHPNREPFFIIVFGLAEDQCNELVEKVWHSSRRITFGVEPREPKPSWMVAIYVHYERFLNPTEKGMARTFMRIFLQKENQKFIMNLIHRDIQRGGRWYGRASSVKEAFSIFIKSVETHLIRRQITGGIDEPLVALYTEPPTDDPEDWIAFRNHVQAQRVGSELTGYPELYKQWVYCQLCHSRDHFVGLCPVPGYPGWRGPKSSDITERRAPDRDHDRDRNRGQAPRGNGQGANFGPPGVQQRPTGRAFNGNRGTGRGNDGEYVYNEY